MFKTELLEKFSSFPLICSQITGPWLKASNHCGKKIYNQPTLGHLGQNSGVHPGQNPSTALGGSKRGIGQYREVHDLRNPPASISGLPSRTLPNRLCKNLRENLYQRKIKQNNKGFNIWNVKYFTIYSLSWELCRFPPHWIAVVCLGQ